MKKAFTFILLSLWLSLPARADSPITSTNFYEAYLDIPAVKKASETGVMDMETAELISSLHTAVDIKAAVINALSWKFEGKNNSDIYRNFLARKYRMSSNDLKPRNMNSHDIFNLAYLTVMDDYFHPENSLSFFEMINGNLRKSYTVSIVEALAKAQFEFDRNWCGVWKTTEKVFNDKSLDDDMREPAKKIIYDYMVLYKPECK